MSEFPYNGTDKEKLAWYIENNIALGELMGKEIVKNVRLENKLKQKKRELNAALLVIKVMSKKGEL